MPNPSRCGAGAKLFTFGIEVYVANFLNFWHRTHSGGPKTAPGSSSAPRAAYPFSQLSLPLLHLLLLSLSLGGVVMDNATPSLGSGRLGPLLRLDPPPPPRLICSTPPLDPCWSSQIRPPRSPSAASYLACHREDDDRDGRSFVRSVGHAPASAQLSAKPSSISLPCSE